MTYTKQKDEMESSKMDEEEKDPKLQVSSKLQTPSTEILQGNALKVYWYLLTNGTRGIREIQRDLGFTYPSTVQYQIKKLIDLGIVSKDENTDKYLVKEEIKTGILGFYVRFGYKMIPRYTLYLLIHFLGLLSFLVIFLFLGLDFILQPLNLLFLLYLMFITLLLVYESNKIWQMKPD